MVFALRTGYNVKLSICLKNFIVTTVVWNFFFWLFSILVCWPFYWFSTLFWLRTQLPVLFYCTSSTCDIVLVHDSNGLLGTNSSVRDTIHEIKWNLRSAGIMGYLRDLRSIVDSAMRYFGTFYPLIWFDSIRVLLVDACRHVGSDFLVNTSAKFLNKARRNCKMIYETEVATKTLQKKQAKYHRIA